MSTIITFSARSLGEAASARARSSSCASHSPRPAVPFIGRLARSSPSSRRNISGEAEQITNRPQSRKAPWRGALAWTARRNKSQGGSSIGARSRSV